ITMGNACADDYLAMLAPLFGRVGKVPEPQGCYRLHGQSDYSSRPFEETLRNVLVLYDHFSQALSRYCRDLGLTPDPEEWKRKSWYHRKHQAIKEILGLVPPGKAFILADQDEWAMGQEIAGRYRLHFPDQDGQYGGAPADDAAAIAELERLLPSGASFL